MIGDTISVTVAKYKQAVHAHVMCSCEWNAATVNKDSTESEAPASFTATPHLLAATTIQPAYLYLAPPSNNSHEYSTTSAGDKPPPKDHTAPAHSISTEASNVHQGTYVCLATVTTGLGRAVPGRQAANGAALQHHPASPARQLTNNTKPYLWDLRPLSNRKIRYSRAQGAQY